MHSVNHKVQLLSPTSLRFVMEDVPVNEVLDQRPEQNTQQKQRRYGNKRQLPSPQRHVKHVANHRQIQRQRNHRMHP